MLEILGVEENKSPIFICPSSTEFVSTGVEVTTDEEIDPKSAGSVGLFLIKYRERLGFHVEASYNVELVFLAEIPKEVRLYAQVRIFTNGEGHVCVECEVRQLNDMSLAAHMISRPVPEYEKSFPV